MEGLYGEIQLLLSLLLQLLLLYVARLFWALPVLEYLYAILGTSLCFLLLVKTLRLQDAFWMVTLCLMMLISLCIMLPYENRFWVEIYCTELLLLALLLLLSILLL